MDTEYSFYPVEPLSEHLAAGCPVLTPNHRLARRIKLAWGRHLSAQGRRAWRTPPVMSLEHWWLDCYRERRVAGDAMAGLVSPTQERALWLHCIESSEELALLRPGAAADLAAEAYRNLQSWNIDWRKSATAQEFGFSEDSRLFLVWAERFESMLAALGMTTLPSLIPDLAAACPRDHIVLAEFDELPPLQREALSRQAAEVTTHQAGGETARCLLQPCDSHRGELEAAALWAFQEHRSDPCRRVGILLPRLQQERREFERILHRVFDSDPRRPETLPVNFSAGVRLDSCGPVKAALALLALPAREFTLPALGHVLYSRYRDQTDIGLEEQGWQNLAREGRSPVTPALLRWSLEKAAGAGGDPPRLLNTLLDASQARELRKARPVADWSDRLYALLSALGWPGPGPLDSLEFQQVEQFYKALAAITELAPVKATLSYQGALAVLEDICARSVFQAQTPDAPIQVLGVLEAAGMQFDALWIAAMGATEWPPAPSPNPFIPFALQRNLGLPHADARRELAYASRLLEHLRRSTKTLIASYARLEDEVVLSPSPLIASFETRTTRDALRWPQAWDTVAASVALEDLPTGVAPAVSASEAATVTGGSAVIGDQAQCPFRAFAHHRLGARPLPEPEPALTAAERGGILHEALFHLWGECETSARLAGLDVAGRQALATRSAATAVTSFRGRAGRFQGEALLDLEQQRLTGLLERWIEVESQRGDFAVTGREQRHEVSLAGLTVTLRIDRIDTLDNGRLLLIDYKSGDAKPRQWLGLRPEEPQLPLYTRAVEGELEGVSFAVLRHDDTGYRGLARSRLAAGIEADIAKATGKSDAALEDWEALLAHWSRVLESLAQEFMSGHVPVDPQDPPRTCTWCGLQALCRIQ